MSSEKSTLFIRLAHNKYEYYKWMNEKQVIRLTLIIIFISLEKSNPNIIWKDKEMLYILRE